MIIVCIRTLLLYGIVLISLRIMGSSELSKMTPFQLVVVFMIAELASIPIDSPTASLVNGIIAIFTLMFLQVLISFVSLRSEKVKKYINGTPIILIEQGKINVKEMRRLRITINDLFEQLRLGNCPCLSDVAYAILESNGELSIITKTQQKTLPRVIISDGNLYYDNISKSDDGIAKLDAALKVRGIQNYKDVFVAFYDGNGQLHIYPNPSKNDTYSKEAI